jgi:hypothetical protein
MHPLILGAGGLAAALLASTVQAAGPGAARVPGSRCPAAGAPVAEQFIPAACADCWTADAPVAAGTWRFDWIVPGADDAALSAAALPDATERLLRLGDTAPGPRAQPARALPGLRLSVGAGPAWQGYFGLQLQLQARGAAALPTGATGWLALVERLPPGSEANAGTRALVRSVAGPLPLDGATGARGLTHLRALRWPTGAKPERLQARAWIEASDGRLLAVAADRCP